MGRALILAITAGLLIGACGGSPAPNPTGTPSAAAIVLRTRLTIAATEGSEPIATGVVLDGSTLREAPFCPGGTVRDTHASNDPAVAQLGLIDRTITCPDGTVRLVFTPGQAQGDVQSGVWTIVGGTGAFERIQGTGTMETVYDETDPALAEETLTGTVTQ